VKPWTGSSVSGQPVYSPEKTLLRHDCVILWALMLASDKPARFRCHAQIKYLMDTGRIDMHYYKAQFRALTELFRDNAHKAIAVL